MERFIDILLVEDDDLDVMDIKRTLSKMTLSINIHQARNGEEAIRMLEGTSGSPTLRPDILLIDINMPKMNGLELLQIIRQNDNWKDLKCFIITTSDEKVDKETAKRLGVSGYIIKPFKLNNFASMDSFNLMIDLMNLRGTV